MAKGASLGQPVYPGLVAPAAMAAFLLGGAVSCLRSAGFTGTVLLASSIPFPIPFLAAACSQEPPQVLFIRWVPPSKALPRN